MRQFTVTLVTVGAQLLEEYASTLIDLLLFICSKKPYN